MNQHHPNHNNFNDIASNESIDGRLNQAPDSSFQDGLVKT